MCLDIEEIMQILPHRYPFLMVDHIIDLVPGERAIGIKNLTINEPYFPGHFPGHPVMPGVLMVEALAQVGACALLCQEKYRDLIVYLAGIDRMRFKKQARPGDVLHMETELVKIKGPIGQGRGKVQVGDSLICEGGFMFGFSASSAG